MGYGRLDGQTISVGLHPVMRGLGFGSQVIRLVSERAGQDVTAWIRPENAASIHAFQKAGYHYQNTTTDAIPLQRWIYPCGSPATI